jgi:hypothetical protein
MLNHDPQFDPEQILPLLSYCYKDRGGHKTDPIFWDRTGTVVTRGNGSSSSPGNGDTFITKNVYLQKDVGQFILHGAASVLESFSFPCSKFEILSEC